MLSGDYRAVDTYVRNTRNDELEDVEVVDYNCLLGKLAKRDLLSTIQTVVYKEVTSAWLAASAPILRIRDGIFLIPGGLSAEAGASLWSSAVGEWPSRAKYNTNRGDLNGAFDPAIAFKQRPRLRWLSLGVGYDWTSRVYEKPAEAPALLPKELIDIGQEVARLIQRMFPCPERHPGGACYRSGSDDIGLARCNCQWDSFEPDCALVNYYRASDRLRGHTDDVEKAMNMPLITLSLGKSGMFLAGGSSLENTPTALVLNDRDILVMGLGARGNYHGVPRLLYPSGGPDESGGSDKDMRINISIRQCWADASHSASAFLMDETGSQT